ncbi:MAG: SDR family NAD(P)-dependent oxidoreductase [Rhodospirillaceae bacterium]|jgi:NAD(P)-dependent dehydrogenase (short-subunit alcohol dehydrogenase family)|nr:SDR family NAD(P)-dependent oxidoreductase [Rhodospirillaceae bacterium]MBT4116369.1 SDR family NAD(P)-dependent oxidoreductase [Rhodospirillaceae bacterium]MBT4748720.1 SDR family NAD(P)-dependent oxidoreductase [Rhodospirillaceae bacterium]
MQDLNGKAAFVTGGASGIGLGMARAFAQAGMKVAIADVEAGPLAAAEAEISALGGECLAIQMDVADREAMRRAAETCNTAFGKMHVLCNNAGVGGTGKPLDEVTAEDWDWVLGVNLVGTVNGLQAFLPLIKDHGEGGHVVNTASMAGLRAYPKRGQGIYITTKFALVGMSEALAPDLEPHGIGVTVLCPGYVNTSIFKAGRNRPQEYGGPFVRDENSELAAGAKNGMDPNIVGDLIVEAILENKLYVMTHDEERHMVEDRHANIMAAFDEVGSRKS